MKEKPFHVSPMAPSDSEEWLYGPERIGHRSGRFFSITGLSFVEPGWSGTGRSLRKPIIVQPDVGLLGFVVDHGPKGTRVLVQRKIEPGNVRGLQLAPTCQATTSNMERVHGGTAPPGAEFFESLPAGARILANSLQSEQGTRFFRKRNRNVALEVERNAETPPPLSPNLRWMEARQLLGMIRQHHRVNSDARSVLVCTPWCTWNERTPFQRHREGFGLWLREAYEAVGEAELRDRSQAHLQWLAGERGRLVADPPGLVSLDELPGFTVDSRGLTGPSGASWDVRHFSIRIPSRERSAWDQPLVVSRGTGLSVLCVFRRGRDLRFVFRAAWEPGLHDGVELQTTICREPGDDGRARVPFPFESAAVGRPALAEAWQSEEGGRFFRERVLHRIVLIEDPGVELPEHHRDLGLREVEALTGHGVFTNESRSTLSLLLSLA